MTISSADDPVAGPFEGNGSQTAFPFAFKVFAKTDLILVRLTGGAQTTLVLDSDYSVALNADQDNNPGGTVTYPISGSPLPSGSKLTATTNLDAVQTTDIQNLGGFYPQVIEDAFDRGVMLIKQIKETLGRTLRFPISDGAVGVELAPASARIGKLLTFDSVGDPALLNVSDISNSIAYGHWRTDTFDGDGSTVQFTLTADPGSINNIDLRVDTVSLTPGIDFSLSGLVITLLTVIPEDDTDNVVARYGQAVPVGELSSSAATYLPPGATTARTVESKLREEVSLEDYWFLGADPTGVLDSSAAYAFAASQAKRVTTNKAATYRFSSPVTLPDYGSEFVNKAGVASVVIMADHVLGAGIQLTRQHQKVIGFYVKSTATRYAAAVSTFNPGIAVGGAAAGTNFLTHCMVWDNIVEEQPGIGIYLGGEGGGTQLHRNAVNYCKGHAYATDDGTIGSRPAVSRSGQIVMTSNRALQCGGNGLNISGAGSTSYRVYVHNHESIDCGWNTDISGLLQAQFLVRGQNITLDHCAADDSGWANTTMSNGKARYAKVAAGDGVDVRNGSTNVRLVNGRYLTLARDGVFRTGVSGFKVADAYSSPAKTVGWRVESGTTGGFIELTDVANYTTPVSSSTANLRGRLVGQDCVFGLSSASYFRLDAAASGTLASDTLNAVASVMYVSGQGGVADELRNISMAGGSVPVPEGCTVRVINLNAYNITVKHGVSNLFTKTAADVVLGQNMGISFASNGTNLYEV